MLVYCDKCERTYHYYKKPLSNNLCNSCFISQQNMNKSTEKELTRKRSFQDLKRTDNNEEDYIASSSGTIDINIEDDECFKKRISQLNREVSDLYQQIKQKKEEIEDLKIKRAVKKAKIETEQKIRRESNKWLPTLDKLTDVQKEIINNLSSDSDDDLDDLLLNTDAEQLFDKICNENLHKN